MIALLLATLIAGSPGGDTVCGPDSGMHYDPIHGVCAPFVVAPPPNATYCYTVECLLPPANQEG